MTSNKLGFIDIELIYVDKIEYTVLGPSVSKLVFSRFDGLEAMDESHPEEKLALVIPTPMLFELARRLRNNLLNHFGPIEDSYAQLKSDIGESHAALLLPPNQEGVKIKSLPSSNSAAKRKPKLRAQKK
jgi:hypothetical protein